LLIIKGFIQLILGGLVKNECDALEKTASKISFFSHICHEANIHCYLEWWSREGGNHTAKGVIRRRVTESLPGHHGTTEMPDKGELQSSAPGLQWPPAAAQAGIRLDV